MLELATLKSIGERAFNAALVVLVGALGGTAVNLFILDWAQVGAVVLGAAVLEALRGLVAATGSGEPSTASLVRRVFRPPRRSSLRATSPRSVLKVMWVLAAAADDLAEGRWCQGFAESEAEPERQQRTQPGGHAARVPGPDARHPYSASAGWGFLLFTPSSCNRLLGHRRWRKRVPRHDGLSMARSGWYPCRPWRQKRFRKTVPSNWRSTPLKIPETVSLWRSEGC